MPNALKNCRRTEMVPLHQTLNLSKRMDYSFNLPESEFSVAHKTLIISINALACVCAIGG
jgi:hypothetical protein